MNTHTYTHTPRFNSLEQVLLSPHYTRKVDHSVWLVIRHTSVELGREREGRREKKREREREKEREKEGANDRRKEERGRGRCHGSDGVL